MSWRAKKRGREGRSGEDLATAMKIAKDKNLPILSIDLVKIKQKYLAPLVLNLVRLDR